MTRIPNTNPTATPSLISSGPAVPGSNNELSLAARAGIGAGVCAVALVSVITFFLFCYRRKDKNSLSTANRQNRLSMHEMNGNPFPEVRELDATEPPVELQASPPSRREMTDSSSDLLGSPPSSPMVELPIYPRQQINEDQEPKSLNQVLESGGLEPKSLSTPQDRPRRP